MTQTYKGALPLRYSILLKMLETPKDEMSHVEEEKKSENEVEEEEIEFTEQEHLHY